MGLDTGLGMLIALEPTDDDPFTAELRNEIRTKMREIIRSMLDVAETEAARYREAVASLKPLTLRRRILNWLERG
jgi:hypothetical protein